MIVAFLGPSLPAAEAKGFRVFPPARQGDVWRAIALRPRAIALIDGVFESQPSVWHHEILDALDAGIPVIGGASMGALRAAELHTLGMRGAGRIFGWYRDGQVIDDSEVALLHASLGPDLLPGPLAAPRPGPRPAALSQPLPAARFEVGGCAPGAPVRAPRAAARGAPPRTASVLAGAAAQAGHHAGSAAGRRGGSSRAATGAALGMGARAGLARVARGDRRGSPDPARRGAPGRARAACGRDRAGATGPFLRAADAERRTFGAGSRSLGGALATALTSTAAVRRLASHARRLRRVARRAARCLKGA